MIDIGFANQILIITDNVSSSRELDNLYLSVFCTFNSSCLFTSVISDSPYCSIFIKLFGFEKPSNLYFSCPSALGIPRFLALIMSGNIHLFILIRFSDPTHFITDFFINIPTGLFGNCNIDVSSNFALNSTLFSIIPLFSDLLALA